MPNAKSKSSSWLVLAIASGACAAFNGVFAKLTTTELTASWSSSIAHALSLSPSNKIVEYGIRGLFFGLNLVFNAIMWGLFTRALTLATSTVRVSVINTSANFMITAILGLLIFSESLPGLWWLGAAFLVAGSVIIGRREEGTKPEENSVDRSDPLLNSEGEPFRDEDGEGRRDDVELDSVKDSDKSSDDEDGVLK
ncbi:hypothetical protein BU23DRAFT_332837 [Bimuria novae-zelandiae CBS 107.79]|uniref:EamA domain-containing protein n=1 Tax=Bimuria novae-zelandiae CBS 107.79 TaxID=1447943 RepID=A0A6A5UMK9_9PLEO|nr:hypothetical protein BU23DRAFT_332837 [Bimuria novae-zelandiae CBS 107.79]